MNAISIIDFINSNHVRTASFKKGTIVSAGEGGNRHIFFLNRPLNEGDDFRYQVPSDAVHIWLDSHLYGRKYQYFLSVHDDTPAVFLKHGKKEFRDTMYYTTEDIENIFREWIASLK